jgi:alanyl-tRNA synthetase
MFEMLGNWSFGDYFKKETISWAWEFLTEICGIDSERLYVTVFEGSSDADALEKDQEAFDIWKDMLPQERILMGAKKDNFWEMGAQGPCGPCSEIHVDIRSKADRLKVSGADLVNRDHPQVVEIWNLVFMQFNRKSGGALEPLPERHIDTGMGFERLCMVLQGVQSSYDTDIFTPLVREIETITASQYGKKEETDIAIRVVADHIRAVSFAIADGQLPGNTGAGYVIRRILRRAIRYGFTFLSAHEPFMHLLVKVLVRQMGGAFPELKDQKQLIENVVREEELSFLKTLEQGLARLEEILKQSKGKSMDGAKAFELYDTFGFPIDLTSLILSERGYALDEAGFDAAMAAQKKRSRAASEVSMADWVVLDEGPPTQFLGYDLLQAEIRLRKYRRVDAKKDGAYYQLVFDCTPFYAEGGGQVGDKGYLEAPNGDVTYILDTKKENNEILHLAKSLPNHPEGVFTASVDEKQRLRTARNHTATHLLHQALRRILGDHVEQKGSAVHSKYLRFDFSHFGKLSPEELRQVEQFVNARIQEQLPFEEQRSISMQQAKEEGAIALFGEKYGDHVRTVRFGKSIELCGGTHVTNTSEIWHFKIISEGAIAAGIRRIEAITSDAVREFFASNDKMLEQIKDLLKNNSDPVSAVSNLQDENAGLKKEVEALVREKVRFIMGELKGQIREVYGLKLLTAHVDLDPAAIKDLAFQLGSEYQDLFLLLGSGREGKAVLSCYISRDLARERNLDAGRIVRELGQYIQGGGGGQPFFATAGGKDVSGIPKALEAVVAFLK